VIRGAVVGTGKIKPGHCPETERTAAYCFPYLLGPWQLINRHPNGLDNSGVLAKALELQLGCAERVPVGFVETTNTVDLLRDDRT